MKTLFLFVAMVVVLGAPAAAGAADVQVIANTGVTATELNADDLKDIFLGSKTAVGGSAVQPVFRENGATHEAFLKAYVGKSDVAMRNHFKTLVFTGKGAQPKAFASDAEVLKYVVSTKGAIGYVSVSADTAGAKKLPIK